MCWARVGHVITGGLQIWGFVWMRVEELGGFGGLGGLGQADGRWERG